MRATFAIVCLIALVGCRKPGPSQPNVSTAPMDAGVPSNAGKPVDSRTPFANCGRLRGADRELCEEGRVLFTTEFTVETGLGLAYPHAGPGTYFNGRSCVSCHSGAGGEGDYDHRSYPDDHNDPSDKLRFNSIKGERTFPPDLPYMIAPPLVGRKFLEELSANDIVSGCGKNEALGISGKAAIGLDGSPAAIGIKGTLKRLDSFNRFAAVRELGLIPPANAELKAPPGVEIPPQELNEHQMLALATFVRLGMELPLTPPSQDKGARDAFERIGCAVCHTIERHGTDACLHRMGEGLRGHVDVNTDEFQFITRPLIGVGPRRSYLHIRPVATVAEAVERHGGEAARVVENWHALTDEDRRRVVDFVVQGL